jgi:hypothetical protein
LTTLQSKYRGAPAFDVSSARGTTSEFVQVFSRRAQQSNHGL